MLFPLQKPNIPSNISILRNSRVPMYGYECAFIDLRVCLCVCVCKQRRKESYSMDHPVRQRGGS